MRSPFLNHGAFGSPISSAIVSITNPNRKARRALAKQAGKKNGRLPAPATNHNTKDSSA